MMELVDGYVCRDGTDVALAKRGVDPVRPPDKAGGAVNARADAENDRKPGNPSDPSVAASRTPLGVNQPLADGPRGTVLNLLI